MLADCDSASRCAERLVLGEANITTAGGGDLDNVNNIAREMVYRCGFSKRLGPVALMDTEEVFIGKGRTRAIANIGTELAAIALTDIEEVGCLPLTPPARFQTMQGFRYPRRLEFVYPLGKPSWTSIMHELP